MRIQTSERCASHAHSLGPAALQRLPAGPVCLRPQVVLCGKGKNFCAGIDFAALEGVVRVLDAQCPGRARERLFRDILRWQVQALSSSLHSGPALTT